MPNYDHQKININNFVVTYAFAQITLACVAKFSTYVFEVSDFIWKMAYKARKGEDHDNAFTTVPTRRIFECKVHSISSTKALPPTHSQTKITETRL